MRQGLCGRNGRSLRGAGDDDGVSGVFRREVGSGDAHIEGDRESVEEEKHSLVAFVLKRLKLFPMTFELCGKRLSRAWM